LPLLTFVGLVAVLTWLTYRWQLEAWLSQLPERVSPRISN
jgi:hypothetical protein